jgi:transposase
MRYIKLSEREQKLLTDLYNSSSDVLIRERCQCLLLSGKGVKSKELMPIFDVTRITIYNWFDLWESEGLSGLSRKTGQGRKRILSTIPQEALEKLVSNNPQNLKIVMREIETQFAVSCHKETLKRQLKNMGLCLQTSKKNTQR